MRKSINSLEELNNFSFEIVKQLKPGDIYLLYGDSDWVKRHLYHM